ncbi:hypothetical protein EON65_31520, partial [archaeon]
MFIIYITFHPFYALIIVEFMFRNLAISCAGLALVLVRRMSDKTSSVLQGSKARKQVKKARTSLIAAAKAASAEGGAVGGAGTVAVAAAAVLDSESEEDEEGAAGFSQDLV